MTKALDEAIIEVESEVEHAPAGADAAADALQRLYRRFALSPMELENIPPGQALAENAAAAAGLRVTRERGGRWLDALIALLAAGLLAMLLLGVDWKIARLLPGAGAPAATETERAAP